MAEDTWQDFILPSSSETSVWELFHENSKIGRYDQPLLSEQVIRERMRTLHDSLPFEGYPIVELPTSNAPLNCSIDEAIGSRSTVRDFTPCPLTIDALASLLQYAYGIKRGEKDRARYRSVPSAGALYPLEIYIHAARIDGLQSGLYHYNPPKNRLRFLREGNKVTEISESLLQPELTLNTSLIVFITAMFERSVFKYQERGYRYIFLEAGHVAQNINLVSTALGLGSVNIGGFFDREIDDFLDLDGVTHSTIYMIAIGKSKEPSQGVLSAL